MSIFERMLSTQSLMFVYVVVGGVIAKLGILRPEGRPSFVALLLNVTLPCMILHSFEQDVGLAELIAAGKILLISTACCLASWAIGKLLWRRDTPKRRAVLEFATMFSNAGSAGLPIVFFVFGKEGVFYASFFLIPLRVLMWTLGLSLFVSGGESKWKTLLMTPSLLVVFIGFPMMLCHVKAPDVLSRAIANLGAMTGPLSMMIIGASLAGVRPREVLDRGAFLLTGVRLLALPLLTLGALKALGVEELLWQVAVTLTAMPAAANTAIIAEMYGRDYPFAAKCVVLSTVLSLVTVPALTLLF